MPIDKSGGRGGRGGRGGGMGGGQQNGRDHDRDRISSMANRMGPAVLSQKASQNAAPKPATHKTLEPQTVRQSGGLRKAASATESLYKPSKL